MDNFAGKKRPNITLSLFATLPGSFKSMKSQRNFEGGVVGLGIVAALTDLNPAHEAFFSAKFTGAAANLSVSPRSSPIPIAPPVGGRDSGGDAAEDELSESYTCVISHIGNSSVKKRVYFGDEVNGMVHGDCSSAAAAAMFSASPLNFGGEVMREFRDTDFLSCCNLCNKQLHGLDIFMYRIALYWFLSEIESALDLNRGEKAFCSADCRDKHIRNENRKEKCRSKAMKPLEYSVSPYSGLMQFYAGIAA